MQKFLITAAVVAGVLFIMPQLLNTLNVPTAGIMDEMITALAVAAILVFIVK